MIHIQMYINMKVQSVHGVCVWASSSVMKTGQHRRKSWWEKERRWRKKLSTALNTQLACILIVLYGREHEYLLSDDSLYPWAAKKRPDAEKRNSKNVKINHYSYIEYVVLFPKFLFNVIPKSINQNQNCIWPIRVPFFQVMLFPLVKF